MGRTVDDVASSHGVVRGKAAGAEIDGSVYLPPRAVNAHVARGRRRRPPIRAGASGGTARVTDEAIMQPLASGGSS